MRTTIQSEGNEVVVRGNGEFVGVIADAVQRYELRLVNRNVQKKAQIFGKETREEMLVRMEKVRAAKVKAKSLDSSMKGILGEQITTKVKSTFGKRGPYKKRTKRQQSHQNWSEDDDKQLADFVVDSKNYKMSGTGNVFIKGFKLNALANRLKRSKKSVSQRICGTKKFSDARNHMKLIYAGSLNTHPKVNADPVNIDKEVAKKKSFFNSWDSEEGK